MVIAHPRHEKIYTTDDYSTSSNSLKNNYYVRNGRLMSGPANMSNGFRDTLPLARRAFQ